MTREITFKPYKKQFQALQLLRDNVTNEVLYWGWARWAKSYLGCAWVIINAYSMPWSAWLIGRNELKRLKATTLITFYEVANSFNLKQWQDFNYNAQDSIITFKNGSMVFLIDLSYMPSDPNYDRLWSYGITYAFIDEAQEISEQAINVLKGRYSKLQWEGWKTIPKSLYTCNPAKNWIYREFYLPYKNGTIRSDRAFVPSLVTDNPSIAPEYIENLRKADNVTVQRLLYWNFEYDDTPWRLFDYDKIISSFSPKTAYNNKRYISCDAARKGKDKAVIFVWEGFNIIDYTIFDTCKTTEITQEIRYYQNKYKIDNQRTIVDEDWVGGWVVDELGCLGFVNNSLPVNPYGAKHQEFLKRNFANLKTQCYFELARVVNDWICFFDVDMEIKSKLCEELDVVVQVDMDKDSKIRIISKEDVKEKIGRSPDYSDACMFRCYFNLVFEWVEEVPEDPKYKDKEFDMWNGKKYTWKELMGEDVIENNEDSIF